jgi:hypothetical protein
MTKTPDLDLRAAVRDPFTIVPQVLDLVRLNGAIFFRSQFRSPWSYTSPPVLELTGALPHAPGSLVLFHIVVEGHCWIALNGGSKRRLSGGDVVVMPYADAYASGSEADAEPVSVTTLLQPRHGLTFHRSTTAAMESARGWYAAISVATPCSLIRCFERSHHCLWSSQQGRPRPG